MGNLNVMQVADRLKAVKTPSYYNGRDLFFKPAYTPAEMLKLGVFGHNYFARATEADLEGLDAETYNAAVAHNNYAKPSWVSNCFKVKAGLPYEWWMEKGLIFEEDPLGWFHWYCRYYAGRRHSRDLHQIARHQNFTRWLSNGREQVRKTGAVSAVVCQSLLQWSYDPMECFNG